MDNFEFCVKILRREQTQFGAVTDASISKEITATSANNMNYDTVNYRNAYLYRCGAVNISLFSQALCQFILDYDGIASLIARWNSSSFLFFCSLSKGPALDYLSFLTAFKDYISAPLLYKTTRVITKHGAWRNTVKSMIEVVAHSLFEPLEGISLGNIKVIQGDPMSNFSKKMIPALSGYDVILMVKSVIDDLDDKVLNSNLMDLFSYLKVGALFFCIETKPKTQKLADLLSLLPGEMLYGPTEVSVQLGFDCDEIYKTEFGCGPIQTARGMFFVWEKKNEASACGLKEKNICPLLSFENLIKNVGQRPKKDETEVEIQNTPACDKFRQSAVSENSATAPSLQLHSETKLSSSDSPFKKDSQLAESLMVDALSEVSDSTLAKILKTDSVVEKAAKLAEASVEESFASQSEIKTSNRRTRKRKKKEKEECDKIKGNSTSCTQFSENSCDSGDSLILTTEFQAKPDPLPVENKRIQTNDDIQKGFSSLTLNASCFPQTKSPTIEGSKTKSEVDDFSISGLSSRSFSRKSDASVNSSAVLNHLSKTNNGPTCDDQVNATQKVTKSVSNYYSSEHIKEDDCQPYQILSDKISDITNQINQLTQSMKEALNASSLEHSHEKKLYNNYCRNAYEHEQRHPFHNCKAHRSAYQRKCLGNPYHQPASPFHGCFKSECCSSCSKANFDCQEHTNIKPCCLPVSPHHSLLKTKCCNSYFNASSDFQEHTNINSCCPSACLIPSCFKNKCCNSCSDSNCDCQEHTNVNSYSNTHLKCQEHTKINAEHVQIPKFGVPLNCLPEEAFFVLKPMCSKLKKD